MSSRRVWVALSVLASGCGGEPTEEPLEITVPPGVVFEVVGDTLGARGLVAWESGFRLYARLRGDDRRVRSGRYAFRRGESWSDILGALTAGRVLTESVTIPEGFTLRLMALRISTITGEAEGSVLQELRSPAFGELFTVPGPDLEGYLYPDTYRFAPGLALRGVVEAMVTRYKAFWTTARRAALDSLELSERELVTLASIIQAEARRIEEMPIISSVYHNRLQRGQLLQADPTVLFALGGPRERLLFAAIDSVAESPYNTYTQPGLPPGPIGAPGEAALEAALHPADTDLLYFVARPNGEHIFTRTLAEHNRAVARARRERDSASAGAPSSRGDDSDRTSGDASRGAR